VHLLVSELHIFYVQFYLQIVPFWGSVEKYVRARLATDDNIKHHMRLAFWVTKATDTHSKYIILIAFLRQQWLRERVSM